MELWCWWWWWKNDSVFFLLHVEINNVLQREMNKLGENMAGFYVNMIHRRDIYKSDRIDIKFKNNKPWELKFNVNIRFVCAYYIICISVNNETIILNQFPSLTVFCLFSFSVTTQISIWRSTRTIEPNNQYRFT